LLNIFKLTRLARLLKLILRYLQKNTRVKDTIRQYDGIVAKARDIFEKKLRDYGPTWRLLRTISITDQLFIKAKRIRSIQMKGANKINESIDTEFYALYNYSIIALIQEELDLVDEPDLSLTQAMKLYDMKSGEIKNLMLKKNHDYGEAWRDMSIESMTDFILVKIYRIKQILQNKGKTLISEGIESNIMDIANYAVFALILINEKKEI